MIYNLSRSVIEDRGRRGFKILMETDSTLTIRVLDLFDLVVLKDDQSLTPCLTGVVGNSPGVWEAWVTSWLTRWVRPGMTFIDVGANNGYYTMLAEKLVGPHGHVVAYEPNPVYAELLRSTRALNDAAFGIRPVALTDKVGTATLSVPDGYHGSATTMKDFSGSKYIPRNYNVRTTTLDNELQRLVFWNHDVIKIDAETAEELIWRGGYSLWSAEASHSTIVLEWTPNAYSEDFLDELFNWGYVFNITFDGGEEPAVREEIKSSSDWQMLVIRRK